MATKTKLIYYWKVSTLLLISGVKYLWQPELNLPTAVTYLHYLYLWSYICMETRTKFTLYCNNIYLWSYLSMETRTKYCNVSTLLHICGVTYLWKPELNTVKYLRYYISLKLLIYGNQN